LPETAAGNLPGLGDVLAGFGAILKRLSVECELSLPGVWEIARSFGRAARPQDKRSGRSDSPIAWHDSGTLRVANEVSGGTVDPGKLVSGLARGAERQGATVAEHASVCSVEFGDPLVLHLACHSEPAPSPVGGGLRRSSGGQRISPRSGGAIALTKLRARQVVFATNAQALELSGLAGRTQPKFTLAVATAPLDQTVLEAIGLGRRKAFYTIDLPYLWGRVMSNGAVVFGAGLVHLGDWHELDSLRIAAGQPAELIATLERRVRGLHPALRSVEFTHRWGGPILFGNAWRPVFARHPRSPHALVLGAYSGHGVAQSVYLGRWAAEVLLGEREPPRWGTIGQ
jgi:glycine/D-amino acid oxidase-like deaminating enzyme